METIVEHLRTKMIRVAEQRGSLTDPDVIAVSQQLDRLINIIQKNRVSLEAHEEGRAAFSHPVVTTPRVATNIARRSIPEHAYY